MMSYRAGRSVVRLHPSSSRTISSRVSPFLFGLQRVPTACKTEPDIPKHLQAKPFRSVTHDLSSSRGYATRPASRPKAHTGRTTKSPRVRKVKETSAETDVKVTVKAVKPKAKPKKKATTKSKSKAKPKAKSKSKAKSKAKPKAKAKARAKKPGTAEEIAAAKLKEQRAHIRELKKTALRPPTAKPASAWQLICKEIGEKAHNLPGKEAAAKYKNLTTEEHEHYNHIANQNKADNTKAYRAWIESFTPDDIRKANNARHNLTRLGVKGFSNRLQDDRQVKRPTVAHTYFLKDRFNSGDMHGIAVTEAMRQIMKEWRDLGEADKQKYYDMQSESRARHAQDLQNVHHRTIDLSATPPAQAAAATASSH